MRIFIFGPVRNKCMTDYARYLTLWILMVRYSVSAISCGSLDQKALLV